MAPENDLPDNIMQQPSFLEMLCKVLPLSSFDLFRELSPLLLRLFRPPYVLLCDPSCLPDNASASRDPWLRSTDIGL